MPLKTLDGEEELYERKRLLFLFFFFFFFFFGHVHHMWKFPGQGWNLHHSSNQSDNTGSLTHCVTRELQPLFQNLLCVEPFCSAHKNGVNTSLSGQGMWIPLEGNSMTVENLFMAVFNHCLRQCLEEFRCGTAETNPTGNHEVAGSIPSLSQWLGIWLCCELWCSSKTWLGSRCSVAVQPQLRFNPLAWESPYASAAKKQNK